MRTIQTGLVRAWRATLAACMLAASAHAATDPAVPNAEDLAPLPGGRWVLASSMGPQLAGPGALVAVDAHGGAVHRLFPDGEVRPAAATAGCPGPLRGGFGPHGIALHHDARHGLRLFVVNHGTRESVEVFAVATQPRPRLRWVGCLPLPEGVLANAVAIARDGTVYVTNMAAPRDGSPNPSPFGGDLLAWRPGTGWQGLPGSTMVSPNGLLLAPDGRTLYVASWSAGELVALQLQGRGVEQRVAERRSLALGLLPDNLRWASDGRILATGHLTSPAVVLDCFQSSAPCADGVPAAIAQVDLTSWAVRCRRPVSLGLATVAVNVGAETWVGTVRGTHIERLPAAAFDAAQCGG